MTVAGLMPVHTGQHQHSNGISSTLVLEVVSSLKKIKKNMSIFCSHFHFLKIGKWLDKLHAREGLHALNFRFGT